MAEAVSLFFWHFTFLVMWMTSQAQAECFVNITQGAARGSVMESLYGREFCSYRGIPYAEPPVGELRFRVSSMPLCYRHTLRGSGIVSTVIPTSI